MRSWEIKIGKQSLTGFLERVDRLRVEGTVLLAKFRLQTQRLFTIAGIIHCPKLLVHLIMSVCRYFVDNVTHFMNPASLLPCIRKDISQCFPYSGNAIGYSHTNPPHTPFLQIPEQ